MKFRLIILLVISLPFLSCNNSYKIVESKGSIVKMDSTLDKYPHKEMSGLVSNYKTRLDKEMNEVIGNSSEYFNYGRPESLLTNLTSDVMKAYGDEHLPGGADIAVMNVHGHRAALPKGKITVGYLFEIYSFDNSITFLELKGSDLMDIFNAYARIGGAGISGNVKLVIDKGKVINVTIDGNPIDMNRVYKIVTLDYLADGNDSMNAFKKAINTEFTGLTLRDLMIDYVREQTRRGNEIVSVLDGRITLVK